MRSCSRVATCLLWLLMQTTRIIFELKFSSYQYLIHVLFKLIDLICLL